MQNLKCLQFPTVFWISGRICYDVNDVGEKDTAEALVLERRAFEIGMSVEKLEIYKSPSVDQPAYRTARHEKHEACYFCLG